MSIENCRLVDLPKMSDFRGNLTFVESGEHVPFEIRRVYYLYDVPAGVERGGHGHRELQQLIVAMAGQVDVLLDDGKDTRLFTLDNCHTGLYVCPMMWRTLDGFSPGSVCMVLASEHYDEGDYYRNYDDFLMASESQT